ncbi:UDP-N-acetylglucosamine--N-acetylmuramyl-(pentapeptide) pyrophosphoryl-undecaprenol N-acetylglucosamine transferase [Desulfuromonas versatilis]|uniref:UDP-N-acetylglucosamine--N-acetylmuramyl-(pentapeptide) pyrophosphoryl-undecaprenol N-acetylglucosamine transferase n=1 Tax=Desulfuromonas versatilis TaxID=2802975 RepID=A0ABN6DV07_9BACT|nr:undecaprenyldiphospho-muramoylpentapeptide beta-N-acetylglucosaminyltransferase [Desulfuromonas versatilis]BCR03962.1 UDP-N-acetylglucosamine--N-acetylmuramyl-(pentapeptide) pyrophosphoryl-undecaprenol N-acetylglucosamine transferase [Desulfuromonas versatilis]
MRLLLAGGGTGGHLFPAVALAQRLLETDPGSEVLFVGTQRGIEARTLPALGLPLRTVDIGGFVGKGWLKQLAVGPQLAKSIWQSLTIITGFKPDVVVGVGGYASGPALVAAKLKGLPVLIHEQNAWPGLTNRLLARWTDRICLSFSESDRAFHHGRTVLTGNPLRKGMDDCPPIPAAQPLLLVFGGSRGARAINDAMVETLAHLAPLKGKFEILHQTGTEDLERVRAGYREAGWNPDSAVPFIQDMAAAYARAHLVLCRAGATTIAELTACGRPSILVPYPYAAADHQTANAQALASKGAGLLLPQSDLNAELLGRMIGDLFHDRERLLSMAGAAFSVGKRGAADLILQECRAIIKKSGW